MGTTMKPSREYPTTTMLTENDIHITIFPDITATTEDHTFLRQRQQHPCKQPIETMEEYEYGVLLSPRRHPLQIDTRNNLISIHIDTNESTRSTIPNFELINYT